MSLGQAFALVWATLGMGFGTYFAVAADRVADLQEKRARREGLGGRRRRSAVTRLYRVGGGALMALGLIVGLVALAGWIP